MLSENAQILAYWQEQKLHVLPDDPRTDWVHSIRWQNELAQARQEAGQSGTAFGDALAAGKAVETLQAAFSPALPPGSTPNSLALSPGERTLFVANADNNAVAVFDVSTPGKSHSLGFIPVGWYPTSVRVTPDGKRLLVVKRAAWRKLDQYIDRIGAGELHVEPLTGGDGVFAGVVEIGIDLPIQAAVRCKRSTV